MRKSILLTAGVFIFLMALMPSSFAKNYIYPVPPPNDTSLNYVKPSPAPKLVRRYHHRHHYHHHHRHRYAYLQHKHNRAHHPLACRHPSRRAAGLYLYYALPGTACCGTTWQLPKANCCAQSGVWPSSYYATFKPAPDDFVYSETNDDDTRPYDMYRDVIADDTIEDPDYY